MTPNRDLQTLQRTLESELRETRRQWEERLDAIRKDRRREAGPLDPDFAEQVVQRENDDALDALDVRGRAEVAAVDAALRRMANGEFGTCVRCGAEIAVERLRAAPTADSCIDCAREAAAAARPN